VRQVGHLPELCVKLVTYQNYTKMHGQKNIKKYIKKSYASVRPSVCDLVSVTKPIIAFSGRIDWLYISSPGYVSLVAIGLLIFVCCLDTQMNF